MLSSEASKALSSEDLRFYAENGYLVSSTLLNETEKELINTGIQEMETWPEKSGKWMKYYEPSRQDGTPILCRIENFIPFSESLRSILCSDKIFSALEQLLGEPVCLYKDKINFKLPNANGFSPHQDSPAFRGQAQKNHITVLIAIDAMTLENGCLEIATNRKEVWQQKITLPHTVKGALLDEIVNELTWAPNIMKPGDIMFFGSYIPHRSGPNLTQKPRRALYVTYNPAMEGDKHEQYYQDKRVAFPPEIEREPGKDYSDGAKIYNFANPIFD